ncbi:MAG: toprim domain-containing protein, partial [Rhizobiales bacterium]|nr:toprim domain-containing protein [Hyphomicrobiales bacterium]
ELKHMDGNEYPALIFRVTDVESKFLGIQRIYLTADGKKINEDAKLTLGNVIGGSLKMGRYKPKTILLSEGIEDGLSLNPLAIKNKDLGIWSGLGANHLMKIDIPDYVERIIICSDNDEITKAVIEKLEARYSDTKTVVTHLPPKKYKDYNQFLTEKSGFQIESHFAEIL